MSAVIPPGTASMPGCQTPDGERLGPQHLYTFTVFTATFNRSRTLPRVYESLRAQTCREFEWLIVDDGSTDHTRELVRSWQQEAAIPIRYIWQENRGKHAAFNQGVQHARGELFLSLDSDDAAVPTAPERFKYHWEAIPAGRRGQFTAVTAPCVDQSGRLLGTAFPQAVFDSDSLEIRYVFKVKGDKWGFHRTDVLKEYPFPLLNGERFVPEGIVWDVIARRYRTRFVNEPPLVVYTGELGRADQLTRSDSPTTTVDGLVFWHRSILCDELDWFRYAPTDFLRSAVHYSRFSLHLGIPVERQVRRLDTFFARLLVITMLPLGFAVYLMDQRWQRRRAAPGRDGKGEEQ